MELGISTACFFHKQHTEDSLISLGRMGVKTVEIFLNSFSEYEPGFVKLLRARLEDNGLSAYSVHPLSSQFESQLFSIHERQKGDAIAIYQRVLDAAAFLNARCYVMHGPAHLSGAAKNLESKRVIDNLAALVELARERGLCLALENVSWCIYHEPEYGAMLKKELSHRGLKYVLDIKQAVRANTNPFDYIEAVGEDLVNVHLCDYRLLNGKPKLMMPASGEFDFKRLKIALMERGYEGPLFIEVYSDMYDGLNELESSYLQLSELFCSH
ncbi:MAG: sugar phosphate isomerase/epimerase [Clostridia bacterium]|nr:sugar phosphate isomerase/epimerase [Clostridia bacterium]